MNKTINPAGGFAPATASGSNSVRPPRTPQPASLNYTGYATLPPDEQFAIRHMLGEHDTPGNRDQLADLIDSAGSDPIVRMMISQHERVFLSLALEGGEVRAIDARAMADARRSYRAEVGQ